MTFETLRAVLAIGTVLSVSYAIWTTVQAHVCEWLYNALPDEEQEAAMWARLEVRCSWLWRFVAWMRAEEPRFDISTFDLPAVPSGTREAIEALPFWDELADAVVHLRAGEAEAFQFELAPYRTELSLPCAQAVLIYCLSKNRGRESTLHPRRYPRGQSVHLAQELRTRF